MVTFKHGDRLKAWELLQKAHELSNKGDPSIAVNYAEVLIANNQLADAKIVLEQIKVDAISLKERKQSLLKEIADKE